LSFGNAHVFYPEASDERCTGALLLDIDPVGPVATGAVPMTLPEGSTNTPMTVRTLARHSQTLRLRVAWRSSLKIKISSCQTIPPINDVR
jgi:hypothetical protein